MGLQGASSWGMSSQMMSREEFYSTEGTTQLWRDGGSESSLQSHGALNRERHPTAPALSGGNIFQIRGPLQDREPYNPMETGG